jgi:hypothetical protein
MAEPVQETTSIPQKTYERLVQLAKRAEQGDQQALPELQKILDEHPVIWQHYGDIAKHAEAAWLQLLAGPDLMKKETIERQLRALEAELAGPQPTPLEVLLVRRIVANWLQVNYADAIAAQTKGPSATPALLRELRERQESAERRFQAATKQLALVRKLLRPVAAPLKTSPWKQEHRFTGNGSEALKDGMGVLN